MTFFATKFSGQPFQVTDARQTMNFIERQKDMERERKEKAKALSEDQKKLGMIAQGMGLEKGEVESMSRGELQGFIQSGIQQSKTVKDAQERELNLRKFMLNQQAQKANSEYNEMMGRAQLENALTSSLNAKRNFLNDQTEREREQAERDAKAQGAQNLINNIQQYASVMVNPQAFTSAQVERAEDFATKYPDVLNQAFAGASSLDVYNTFLNAKAKDPADRKLTPEEEIEQVARETVARETGKDYTEWMESGGPTTAQETVKKMTRVLSLLETGKVDTGKLIDFVTETGRAFMNPMDVEAEQEILKIAQARLKETLGGQFTEREAKLFFQRAYDPRLPSGTNMRKIKSAIHDIMVRENFRMQYFEQFGKDATKLKDFKYDPTRNVLGPSATSFQSTSNGLGFSIPGAKTPTK